MPRIKRWFPVSHDINRDPELWDLCAKHGEKALRCWLEILSIADRNDGRVPGELNSISTNISWAIRCRSTRTRLILDSMLTMNWIQFDKGLIVTNYAKYHRIKEAENDPNEIPPDQTRPDQTETRPKKKITSTPRSPEEPSMWPSPEKLVELYNELTPDQCPAVTTVSRARIEKAKKYLAMFPTEQFWREVFQQIHRSRFLRGLVKSNGHQSFVADFDWLLTKGKDGTENVVKVHDGRYVDG